MKVYLRNYLRYLRQCAVGLLLAPFSSNLWQDFVDSAVNTLMTLWCFVFLIACIVAYPIAVPAFALWSCETERRSVKSRHKHLEAMNRGDCVDWSDESDEGPRCRKGSPQVGVTGYTCSRTAGHDGPCALHFLDKESE